MSKKRVHEIAKELKGHGIELDNKEVVTELTNLGYDVKSHSSSLEDDQAIAAVQKILDKRKPKAPSAPLAAKGFVVRRKVVAAPGMEGEHAEEPSYREAPPAPPAAPPAAEAHAPAAAEPAPQHEEPALVAAVAQPPAPEVPAAPSTAAPTAEAPAMPQPLPPAVAAAKPEAA